MTNRQCLLRRGYSHRTHTHVCFIKVYKCSDVIQTEHNVLFCYFSSNHHFAVLQFKPPQTLTQEWEYFCFPCCPWPQHGFNFMGLYPSQIDW